MYGLERGPKPQPSSSSRAFRDKRIMLQIILSFQLARVHGRCHRRIMTLKIMVKTMREKIKTGSRKPP